MSDPLEGLDPNQLVRIPPEGGAEFGLPGERVKQLKNVTLRELERHITALDTEVSRDRFVANVLRGDWGEASPG